MVKSDPPHRQPLSELPRDVVGGGATREDELVEDPAAGSGGFFGGDEGVFPVLAGLFLTAEQDGNQEGVPSAPPAGV